MRKHLLLALVAILSLLILSPGTSSAQKESKEDIKRIFKEYHQNGGNQTPQGREFWIPIPANETPQASSNALEIYVASEFSTIVRLQNAQGLNVSKVCKAGETVTFSSKTGEINAKDLEIRDYGRVVNKAVSITADHPVSVYVLNAKPVSSEGFMAIPTSVFGTEYINCSYYDFNESRQWGSGFLVVAAHNETFVTIKLKGKGKEYAKTKDGKKIGYTYRKRLDKGDVFCVEGDGLTRAQFDMTGSSIKADKPIGVVSYHQRCMVPATIVTTGRDHLSEMMIPIDKWGKTYASIELNRGKDKGDLFRIVAAEDKTIVNIRWYDRITKKLIGSNLGLTLEKKGDFAEIIAQAGNNGDLESVRGSSVFEADKPILVMQYSYSANWDNAHGNYDPFMFQIACEEQFIEGTIFQAPQNQAFNENFLNIVAYGGDLKTEGAAVVRKRLESLKLDGTAISLRDSKFLSNNIPNTNFFWARTKINPGMHSIYGDGVAKFGGYIYGFSSFDSYGWPAAMSLRDLSKVDTVPPQTTSPKEDLDCGKYRFYMEELVNGKEDDDPKQEDTGVDSNNVIRLNGSVEQYEEFKKKFAAKRFIKDGITDATIFAARYTSKNYDSPKEFKVIQKLNKKIEDGIAKVFSFVVEVTDITKDADIYIMVRDQAGNYTIKEAHYRPAVIELIKPKPINFGDVRINTIKTIACTFKNTGTGIAEFDDVIFIDNKYFSIKGDYPTPIAPGAEFVLTIEFAPVNEILDPTKYDLDSLVFTTPCLRFPFDLRGRGVLPVIEVQDIEFGSKTVGSLPTEDPTQGTPPHRGVRIYNHGSMTLSVTGYDEAIIKDDFAFDKTKRTYPFVIEPGKFIDILGTSYIRNVASATPLGETIDIKFQHDGGIRTKTTDNSKNGSDDVSVWHGVCKDGGIDVTSYDFGKIRLDLSPTTLIDKANELNTKDYDIASFTGYVCVYNTGKDNVQISDISWESNDDNVFEFNESAPLKLGPKDNPRIILVPQGKDANISKKEVNVLTLKYTFTPKSEKNYEGIFKVTGTIGGFERFSIGKLKGIGILPHIAVDHAIFDGVLNLLSEEVGPKTVTISNDGSEKLSIKGISLKPVPNNEPKDDSPDFTLVKVGDQDIADVDWTKVVIEPTQELKLQYNYRPTSKNDATDLQEPGKPGFTKRAKVVVNCDAYKAESNAIVFKDFVEYDKAGATKEGYVEGYYGDGSMSVAAIPFGTLSRCATGTLPVVLNTGALSPKIILRKIEITGADEAVFSLVDVPATLPKELVFDATKPHNNTEIKVLYTPSNDAEAADKPHTATVKVTYALSIAPDEELFTEAPITAVSHVTEIAIDVNSLNVKEPGFYTYLAQGKDITPDPVNIRLKTDDWAPADISSITLSLRYKERWFQWDANPFVVNGQNMLTSTTEVKADGEYMIRSITMSYDKAANGGKAFEANGGEILINPQVRVMISNEDLYKTDVSLSIEGRDNCVTVVNGSFEIPLRNCVKDLFKLKYTNANNAIEPIMPNPVSENRLEINYSLALTGQASMELYNANGDKIRTIFNSVQTHGKRTKKIDLQDLSSGVYFIRLTSGEYTSSQKLIIRK